MKKSYPLQHQFLYHNILCRESSKTHLGLYQTSAMERLAVKYYREKTPSYRVDRVLIKPLELKMLTLILSWQRSLSYRNQSIDLFCKSIDWVVYDRGLGHERVNKTFCKLILAFSVLLSVLWSYQEWAQIFEHKPRKTLKIYFWSNLCKIALVISSVNKIL